MKQLLLFFVLLLFSIQSSYWENTPCNVTIKTFIPAGTLNFDDEPEIKNFDNKYRIINFQTLGSCEWWKQVFENLDFWDISWIKKYSYSDYTLLTAWFLPQESPEPIEEEIINTPNNWIIYISKYEGNKYYINFSIEHILLQFWKYYDPIYVENIDEVINDFKLISSTLNIYSEDIVWDWNLLKTYDVQFLSTMVHLVDEDLMEMYGSSNTNGLIAKYLWQEKVIYIKNSDKFQDCWMRWIICEFKWYDKGKNALKIWWSVQWYLVNDWEEPVIIPEEFYFINVDTWEVFKEDEMKNTWWNDWEFHIYNPKRPNLYWYKTITLNENWEFVIEYDKQYYEKLLKVYWGKWKLFFETTSKNNFHYWFEKKDDSIIITIQKTKDYYKNILKSYSGILDYNNIDYKTFSEKETFPFFSGFLYGWWYLGFYDEIDNWKIQSFYNSLLNLDYKKLWELYGNNEKNSFIGSKIYFKSNYGSFHNKYDEYLKTKYHNNLNNDNQSKSFTFDIIEDFELLNKFVEDNIYFDTLMTLSPNLWGLYVNWTNELYYIWETNNEDNNISINYDNLSFNCYNWQCNVFWKSNFSFNLADFISTVWNQTYLNISKILQYVKENNLIENVNLEKIVRINFNWDTFSFPFIKEENFLHLASKIASPKDINKNPFMIWFNFLLAFLYLITFYFTAQIFNSYFEKVVEKQNINKKLSDISIFIFELPFIKLNNFFKKIFEKRKYQKLLNINQKIAQFFHKNEHKIYVFLWLLALWIIWQITVDDFDVLSLKWLFTIFLMIFILWLITFFKDFVLYFLNKWKEKEKLKIENIPIWFILATIVTSTWRIVWLEPNMLFWNVLRINTKDNQVEKKLSSSKLLFKVLVITFIVWLIFWFLTVLFSPDSFFYKFFIIAYFWIVNDVFFALLPFWLLWGTFILKDKKMKWKWFIFSFIVLWFLLHTILNPEWDLQKILDFDGNIFILAGFLIFWIVITCITYFYIKQNERKIAE